MSGWLSLSGHPLEAERIVRLVYVDEAGLSNRQHEPWLVVGAVIVDADKQLADVERHLDDIVRRHIPQEHWDDFVFHATHLFNCGGKVFTKDNPDWPLQKRLAIADELAAVPKKFKLALTFGACERAKFADLAPVERQYADADITRAAHILTYLGCATNVERWMRENTNDEVCLMIVEDNQNVRFHIKLLQRFYQRGELSQSILSLLLPEA